MSYPLELSRLHNLQNSFEISCQTFLSSFSNSYRMWTKPVPYIIIYIFLMALGYYIALLLVIGWKSVTQKLSPSPGFWHSP